MSDTASDLASGSQDLAALLGLFCTQGVERNALANNFGYGTVIASSLSLLGVLGLVKSSIKLALGLKHCEQAGFNLDSLRGIFRLSRRRESEPRDKAGLHGCEGEVCRRGSVD